MIPLIVDYKDLSGAHSTLSVPLGLPALFKHAAVAGVPARSRRLAWPYRGVGMLLAYFDYLHLSGGGLIGFTRLPISDRDPTEQGQFSTLVGRAVADFLARRLLGVTESISYEAAMLLAGIKIRSERPDFICLTAKNLIAIEAKGLAKRSLSAAAFRAHKVQAGRGPIPVAASVASATFDLFGSPRVRFHDPSASDEGQLSALRERIRLAYYAPYRVLAARFSDFPTRSVADREYLRVPIAPILDPADAAVSLLIDKRLSRDSVALSQGRRSYEVMMTDELYIDSDGIGAEVRSNELSEVLESFMRSS